MSDRQPTATDTAVALALLPLLGAPDLPDALRRFADLYEASMPPTVPR